MAKAKNKKAAGHTRVDLAQALAFIRKAQMSDEYLAFVAKELKRGKRESN